MDVLADILQRTIREVGFADELGRPALRYAVSATDAPRLSYAISLELRFERPSGKTETDFFMVEKCPIAEGVAAGELRRGVITFFSPPYFVPPLTRALPSKLAIHSTFLNVAARAAANRLIRTSSHTSASALPAWQLLDSCLRAYVAGAAPLCGGWIAGLADTLVAESLEILHRDYERRWTVPAIADLLRVERTYFAKRFTRVVGVSPIHYFLDWKMRLAANEIVASNRSIGAIARSFGYSDHSVFTAAFTRVFGKSPTDYRSAAVPRQAFDALLE